MRQPHACMDASSRVRISTVGTDAPSNGALFSWNLGDPFLKSNMVIFYYGNLTHPSVDPPKIGFVSLVPDNADQLFTQAVDDAQKDGSFECKSSECLLTVTVELTGVLFSQGGFGTHCEQPHHRGRLLHGRRGPI